MHLNDGVQRRWYQISITFSAISMALPESDGIRHMPFEDVMDNYKADAYVRGAVMSESVVINPHFNAAEVGSICVGNRILAASKITWRLHALQTALILFSQIHSR